MSDAREIAENQDFSQYEDELPKDIPRQDYDRWFAMSKIDGVRVGPKYPFKSIDARATAGRLVSKYFDEGVTEKSARRWLIDHIEAALLAERERCAKIAEDVAAEWQSNARNIARADDLVGGLAHTTYTQYAAIVSQIAAVIRKESGND